MEVSSVKNSTLTIFYKEPGSKESINAYLTAQNREINYITAPGQWLALKSVRVMIRLSLSSILAGVLSGIVL